MPKATSMLRHRLLIAIRSVLVGWALLLLLSYAIERPLLIGTARLLGGDWLATAKVSLDCMELAATGWVIGRLHRSAPLLGVLAFGATLAFCRFDPLLDIRLPWLVRLAADAFRDADYLNALASTAFQYLLLFASLIVGALLSRPGQIPLSVINENLQRGDGKDLIV